MDIEASVDSDTSPPHSEQPVVEVLDMRVSFGGVHAVQGVSLELFRGRALGLVGPNGSGKSTLLNAMSGLVRATGDVKVCGMRIPSHSPTQSRRMGLMRTFQTPQVYPNLSGLENVLLACDDRRGTDLFSALCRRRRMRRLEHDRWDVAYSALHSLGIESFASISAGNLSYGEQRRLELARVVASRPVAVLLDEPSAGLNEAETKQLVPILAAIRDAEIAVLLVDHKVDFVDQVCASVVVLDHGRVIAHGPSRAVWADPQVVAAYVGGGEV